MLLLPWDHLRGRIWLVLACPSSSHYNHGRGRGFRFDNMSTGKPPRAHDVGEGEVSVCKSERRQVPKEIWQGEFSQQSLPPSCLAMTLSLFSLSQLAGEKSQYLKGGLSVLCRDTREQTKLCESSRLTHSEFQGVTDSQKEGQKRKKGWGMMDDDADEPQRHTIYNIQTTVWIPIPNGWEQSGMPNRNKMRRRCLIWLGGGW